MSSTGPADDAPRIDSADALLRATDAATTLTSVIIEGGFTWPAENIDCRFVACRFEDCTLAGAELVEASFARCEFQACSLRGSNLRDTLFQRCRFYVDDNACDFRYAELRDAQFEDCDLTTATFERANAYGLRLTRCQAQGASFVEVDFAMTLARNHRVTELAISDSNLAYADFSGTHLAGCSIQGTRLSHAIFQHCDLSDAQLNDCELSNIEADQLNLSGCDLRGSQFNNLDPRRIDLTNTRVDAEQAVTLLTTMGISVET